jgi:CheY-like chemotaxis protein
VAKILVADDNSNIQRMVGLALKDQGIEVVAVGNGEAAVRKISELRPDLVLADVFMPVRNGYEVCQYVKEDTSLAHIPVILLVGAFDPLDEQEAQRVGADGVLKKPFVPPDPLIAMVKTALDRAGISLTPGGAAKEAAGQKKASDVLPKVTAPAAPPVSPLAGVAFTSPKPKHETRAPAAESPVPAPVASGSSYSALPSPVASTPAPSFAPVIGDESFVDEPAATVAADASKPMDFGGLLSASANRPEAEEEVETTATAADWRSLDEPNDVPEEEEEVKVEPVDSLPSWRRDAGEVFASEDAAAPLTDWRDSEAAKTVVGRKSARETWEQQETAGGFVSAAEVPTDFGVFASAPVEEVAGLNGEAHAENVATAQKSGVGVAEELAADHSGMHDGHAADAHAEAFADHSTAVAVAPVDSAHAVVEAPVGHVEAHQERSPEPEHRESAWQEPVHQEPVHREPEHFEQPVHAERHERAVSEHHEVAAQELAPSAAAEAPVVETVHAEETHHAPQVLEEPVPEPAAQQWHEEKPAAPAPNPSSSWFSIPSSPWDTEVRRPTSLEASWETPKPPSAFGGHPSANGASANGTSTVEEIAAVVSDEPGAQASSSTEPDVDELAAKVIARISPEALEAITREVLKPVIASLIADELKLRK